MALHANYYVISCECTLNWSKIRVLFSSKGGGEVGWRIWSVQVRAFSPLINETNTLFLSSQVFWSMIFVHLEFIEHKYFPRFEYSSF